MTAVPTCVRRLTFEAGHRVYGHENKCANLHGHSYKVLVEARAAQLDGIGRVIDFSVLKQKIGTWIDENWDHAFIYYQQDHDVYDALTRVGGRRFGLPANPTAENLADHLLRSVCPTVLKDAGVEVHRVTVHETENCYAVAEL